MKVRVSTAFGVRDVGLIARHVDLEVVALDPHPNGMDQGSA